MRPTSDDFEPRRDGWFEHKGTWQEVTVGTVIASRKRSERWEIISQHHGQQVEYGHTLWMRAREQNTGAEFIVEPRVKTSVVTILTQDPADFATADPTYPTDSESIALLVEKLGATHLASRDLKTGEITCPYYEAGENHLDEIGDGALRRGLAEHLKFAHNLNPPEGTVCIDLSHVHSQSHDPKHPSIGKGGFPHRHIPEDLTFL